MGGALAEVGRFRHERVKIFKEDVFAMEAIRKTLRKVVIERGFAPGRPRHTSMARAYERLVPIRRIPLRQESENRWCTAGEVCVCAQ
jgi:hypothetical protein